MTKTFFLKIVVIGNRSVDKLSLIEKLIGKSIRKDHLMTIGADYIVYEMEVNSNHITYQIWMLSNDAFQTVRSRFYEGAMGGICVFNLAKKETLDQLENYIDVLWENSGRGIVPIVLLGNKHANCDLISQDIINEFIARINSKMKSKVFKIEYFEDTSQSNENISLAINELSLQIIKGFEMGILNYFQDEKDQIF